MSEKIFDPIVMGKIGSDGTLYTETAYYPEQLEELYAKGNYPLLNKEPPANEDPTKVYLAHYYVSEYEGISVIDTTFEEVVNEMYVNDEIDKLKKQLTATDYMWVKTYEARVMGKDDPYTQEQLTASAAEREDIRERINALEKMLY